MGPILSNDGRHIAFVSQHPDGKVVAANISAETGDLELEKDIPPTYDPNGGGCWMPDNRHVAAVDLRTGVANLRAIPVFADGADRQLTHFSSDGIWGCSYSSDGKHIAIARGPQTSETSSYSATRTDGDVRAAPSSVIRYREFGPFIRQLANYNPTV